MASTDVNQLSTVTSRFETDRAIVRLSGPVTVDSILELCDEIDLALDYYQYPTLELQLASPGGDIAALDYYLQRLIQWRSPPVVRIETLGLTQAASAAAIMLSLGDIGYRSCYASTNLLYHDPRVMIPNSVTATRARLSQLSESLDATEERMLRIMVEHIWNGALAHLSKPVLMRLPKDTSNREINAAGDLHALYAALNVRDEDITPNDARALHLIDSVVGVTASPVARVVSSDGIGNNQQLNL